MNQCDYYDDASQNDPIVAEYFKVMLLDIAHQELDRYDRQAKGYQASQYQQAEFCPCKMKSKLHQFQ